MSNVINYSKPSATVFKRSIKGSVHMKHTSHWPAEERRELGNGGPGRSRSRPHQMGRASSRDTGVQFGPTVKGRESEGAGLKS